MEAAEETIVVLADVPKNSREVIRISQKQYRGHDLIDIRVWYSATDGSLRPTAKGVSLKTDLLPELMEALSTAQAEVGREAA